MPGSTHSSPSLGTGTIILIVLGALSIPIGSVAVLIYGLVRYLKTTTKVTWEEKIPQLVPDRRYKTGQRFIGNMVVKRSNIIQANDLFKSEYRKQGIIIMVVGALSLMLGIISLIFS